MNYANSPKKIDRQRRVADRLAFNTARLREAASKIQTTDQLDAILADIPTDELRQQVRQRILDVAPHLRPM